MSIKSDIIVEFWQLYEIQNEYCIVVWAINIINSSHMSLLFDSGEKDSVFDCTECYSPVTKQWTTVASMNHPAVAWGIVYVMDYLCFG